MAFNGDLYITFKSDNNIRDEQHVACYNNLLPIKKTLLMDNGCNNINFQIVTSEKYYSFQLIILISFVKDKLIMQKNKITFYLNEMNYNDVNESFYNFNKIYLQKGCDKMNIEISLS